MNTRFKNIPMYMQCFRKILLNDPMGVCAEDLHYFMHPCFEEGGIFDVWDRIYDLMKTVHPDSKEMYAMCALSIGLAWDEMWNRKERIELDENLRKYFTMTGEVEFFEQIRGNY